jgi:hypothetical protein
MFVLHAVVTSEFRLEAKRATVDNKLLQINITLKMYGESNIN